MANIHVKKTNIEGLYVIEPIVFSDYRGIYFETYNYEVFSSYGLNYHFVQDNESVSKKGVLRGMHVNMKHPQGKLIRVLSGEILDVVIDLRKESKNYIFQREWDTAILQCKIAVSYLRLRRIIFQMMKLVLRGIVRQ